MAAHSNFVPPTFLFTGIYGEQTDDSHRHVSCKILELEHTVFCRKILAANSLGALFDEPAIVEHVRMTSKTK